MKTMYSASGSEMGNIFLYNTEGEKEIGKELVESVRKTSNEKTKKLLKEGLSNGLKGLEPQERMDWLKEQFEIAEVEARETNEGARAEILPLLDKIGPLYLYPEAYGGEKNMSWNLKRFEELKEILNTYSGDMSDVLEDIAAIWHESDKPFYKGSNFFENPLKGEALIKKFKEYIDELQVSGQKGDQMTFQNAQALSFWFAQVIEELQKKEKRIDE